MTLVVGRDALWRSLRKSVRVSRKADACVPPFAPQLAAGGRASLNGDSPPSPSSRASPRHIDKGTAPAAATAGGGARRRSSGTGERTSGGAAVRASAGGGGGAPPAAASSGAATGQRYRLERALAGEHSRGQSLADSILDEVMAAGGGGAGADPGYDSDESLSRRLSASGAALGSAAARALGGVGCGPSRPGSGQRSRPASAGGSRPTSGAAAKLPLLLSAIPPVPNLPPLRA